MLSCLFPKVTVKNKWNRWKGLGWRQSWVGGLLCILMECILSMPCSGPLRWILSILSVFLFQNWSAFATNGLHLWIFFSRLPLCQMLKLQHLEALNQSLCQPGSLDLGGMTETKSAMQCSPLRSGLGLKPHPCLSLSSPLSCPRTPLNYRFLLELCLYKLLVHNSHPKKRELVLGQFINV